MAVSRFCLQTAYTQKEGGLDSCGMYPQILTTVFNHTKASACNRCDNAEKNHEDTRTCKIPFPATTHRVLQFRMHTACHSFDCTCSVSHTVVRAQGLSVIVKAEHHQSLNVSYLTRALSTASVSAHLIRFALNLDDVHSQTHIHAVYYNTYMCAG